MGTEENKAVVRRFMHEVLADGNLDVADEVLAPDYLNLAMGGSDLAGVKAMTAATNAALDNAALEGQRFEDEELVAEGDAVFARFNYILTLPDGSTTTARTLAYYRLADGKIVLNDVMFDPDLMQVLGQLLAPPPEAQS
jgi:ketosteroid isomerase-like protein